MSRLPSARATSRRTVLVASASDAFLDILGAMVEGSGFQPAFCLQPEPAALALTRTQPELVVCDCEILDGATNRLIAETLAQGLPLLMTTPRGLSDTDLGRLHLPHRAQWLRFPIGDSAFMALLEKTLAPLPRSVAPAVPPVPWLGLEGIVNVHVVSRAPLQVAKTAHELFDIFAARIAEILRDRFRMDPEPLLRARRDEFTMEGLVSRAPDGALEWHRVRVTREQLEWNGPDAMAESFVRGYRAAFAAARGGDG